MYNYIKNRICVTWKIGNNCKRIQKYVEKERNIISNLFPNSYKAYGGYLFK